MEDTFKKLYEKLSTDGIQRTDDSQTHKGYNTSGYGYQWIVDRFNDVFGFNWGFNWTIMDKHEGTYKTGKPFVDLTVNVSIWIKLKDNSEKIERQCVGGHTSIIFSDALKGAITNGLKKTAAFYGVGADAFRGEIDDDANLPDKAENKLTKEQEATAKLQTLPENVKEGFKILGYKSNIVWQICNDFKWDNDKILAELNKRVDSQVPYTQVAGL